MLIFGNNSLKLNELQHLKTYPNLQRHGHLPTLSEFYFEYGNINKVNSIYSSWFELIAKIHDIDAQAQKDAAELAPFTGLNKGMQTTNMTKCFKAIVKAV